MLYMCKAHPVKILLVLGLMHIFLQLSRWMLDVRCWIHLSNEFKVGLTHFECCLSGKRYKGGPKHAWATATVPAPARPSTSRPIPSAPVESKKEAPQASQHRVEETESEEEPIPAQCHSPRLHQCRVAIISDSESDQPKHKSPLFSSSDSEQRKSKSPLFSSSDDDLPSLTSFLQKGKGKGER